MVILIQIFGTVSFGIGIVLAWTYWPEPFSLRPFDPVPLSYSAALFLGGLFWLAIQFGFADLIQSGRDIRNHLATMRGEPAGQAARQSEPA